LDTVNEPLTKELIKKFHSILKTGTSDVQKAWFVVGGWKKLANEHGLKEFSRTRDYLIDTCLSAQDTYTA
jgi:hypothetical protein